jgi:outer membrane protein assembly factor BamB
MGAGFSSPAVVGDTVYISGDVGPDLVITALDMNGQARWLTRHGKGWTAGGSPGALGSPVVSEGKLYLLSAHGILKCYDTKDGKEEWAAGLVAQFGGASPGYGYSESPLVYKNMVVVTPGGGNCLVALNGKTGETIWMSTGLNDPAGQASAIAVEFQGYPMVVQMTGKGMVAVDARDGKFLWRCDRAVSGAACASPVYADGYCFGATGYGNGGACVKLSVEDDAVRATQVWDTKDMICHHGGYIVHQGHIYGNHLDGWSCLELATGKEKWNDRGVGKGSLCYADGMLYTYGESGGWIGLVHAKQDTFEQAGKFRVEGRGNSWAYPVVVSGRLYVRYDTNLYCYDVRGPDFRGGPQEAPTPEPQKEADNAPAGEELARRLFIAANVLLECEAPHLARKAYEELVKKYPDSPYAVKAADKLREIPQK